MFEKYIMIKDTKIMCGQTSNGIWYCKELPAENTRELDALIGDINTILNKYNSTQSEKTTKEKKTNVKGLK